MIKRSINESLSEYDYIEPMKNRKYYQSYSQAFKRLNLIAKEVNINEGYDKNISLFTESELEKEEKKYFLNVGKKETNEQAAPAPAPVAAAPTPEPAPVESEPTDEIPDELPDDFSDETEVETEDETEMSDDVVTIKTIQKLTGKLAQKLRAFGDGEEEMSSNDIKYVINSILSALNLESLDEDDKEQIMSKLEGSEDETMGDETMGDESDEMSGEVEEPSNVGPEEEMGTEMAEGFDDFETEFYRQGKDFDEDEFDSIPLGKTSHRNLEDDSTTPTKFFHNQIKNKFNDLTDFDIDYDGEFNENIRPEKISRLKHDSIKDHEASKLEDMIEGLFTESKVDKVLSKYFTPTENTVPNKKELVSKVRNSSVNVIQEMVSLKLIKKHPNVKFLGKNKNNNLVFESKNKQVRITPNGEIL